jgi:hypothetical protein
MVGHPMHIRREKGLIEFVNVNANVGPPQKRLHKRSAVVEPHLQFDVRISRVQAHAVHSLHPVHRIVVTAPDGLRTIRVLFDLEIRWHECRRTMVLRPVKLYAS